MGLMTGGKCVFAYVYIESEQVRVRVRVRHSEVHSDVTVFVAVDVFLQEREGGRRDGWRENGREKVFSVLS